MSFLDETYSNSFSQPDYLKDTKSTLGNLTIHRYTYNKTKQDNLIHNIYPFWVDTFIKSNKENMFWNNSVLASEIMGLKNNTLCFEFSIPTNIAPIGFCTLLLLDQFDLDGLTSPFKNSIYKDSLFFYNFFIKEEYRGKGFGKEITNYILEFVNTNFNKTYKYLILHLDDENKIATSIYDKLGFTNEGLNPTNHSQKLYRYTLL